MIKNIWRTIIPVNFREIISFEYKVLNFNLMAIFTVERIYNKLCKSIDHSSINYLNSKYRAQIIADPECAAKYSNVGFWLRQNVLRAVKLNLDKNKIIKILDIGCGPGYFLAVLKYLGHDALGLDAPDNYLTPTEIEVFREINTSLTTNRQRIPIISNTKTEIDQGFDLITSFLVCFNNHKRVDEWTKTEWEYFVNDMKSKLNYGGLIHLELNENIQKYGDLKYYDQDTLSYFESVGKVKKNVITIEKNKK